MTDLITDFPAAPHPRGVPEHLECFDLGARYRRGGSVAIYDRAANKHVIIDKGQTGPGIRAALNNLGYSNGQ